MQSKGICLEQGQEKKVGRYKMYVIIKKEKKPGFIPLMKLLSIEVFM